MTEQRQAEALARWLSQGGEAPDEVGDDVVQAVLALRPDLAPPPSLSIDDVLDCLTAGPLAPDTASATRLAGWLDSGEFPDEAEDPELEAVFALRPELAPAPRVSIDDILGAVREGPLAERPVGAPEPTLPASIGELPEPVVVANTVPREHRRLPPWFLPGAGVLLMAALALLVVLPVKDAAPRLAAPTTPIMASAPAEEAARDPSDLETVPEAAPRPTSPDSSAAASPAEPTVALGRAAGEGYAGGLMPDGANAVEEKVPADAPAKDMSTLDIAPTTASSGPATTPAREPPGEAPEVAKETQSALSSFGYLDDAEGASGAAPQPAQPTSIARGTGGASAGAATGGSRDETRSSTTIAEAEDDDRQASRADHAYSEEIQAQSKSSRRQLEVESGRKGNDKPKTETATTAPAPVTQASADQTETWYDGDDGLASADAALASGDAASAEAALKQLLSSADSRIAMQAALRLARLYIDQGRKAEALAVIQKGQALRGTSAEDQAKLKALQDELTR